MIAIKQQVILLIKDNPQVKAKLAYEFRKGIRTIERWIKQEDILLTTPLAVNVIAQELKIDKSEILTEKQP